MREEFQAELDEVSRLLVAMADEVRGLLSRATTALLVADKELGEAVISGDTAVNDLYREVEEKVYLLLARQAPVASDLRHVVTALHIATDIERMGDLAKHVARTALRRHPAVAVPPELAKVIKKMADAADALAAKISEVLAHKDAEKAAELERDDDIIDELHRGLFVVMLGAAWQHGVEAAIDGALLGRFYERFADHAVNAGYQLFYFVTGEQLVRS
ncbi:phosphate signaling complex protein PhoU [Luedemannella flava]|uniref:Phosphate-specific transport system accessory protein PhoU n=1 Tax=Luedemannella flava TaxID=349316 RepID=A0ABN2M6S0_9ACTN